MESRKILLSLLKEDAEPINKCFSYVFPELRSRDQDLFEVASQAYF